MTKLRQAAQAVLERWDSPSWQWVMHGPTADLMAALRTALAQPEQEPVAWMSSDRAWMWSDYSKALAAVAHIPRLTLIPLYTTPPQRPWQGLTPDEVKHLYPYGRSVWGKETFEAIEKALKEKNNAN